MSAYIKYLFLNIYFLFYFIFIFLKEIPIVIAGNKLDLASTHREVTIEDVSEWVYCELPKLRFV